MLQHFEDYNDLPKKKKKKKDDSKKHENERLCWPLRILLSVGGKKAKTSRPRLAVVGVKGRAEWGRWWWWWVVGVEGSLSTAYQMDKQALCI